MTRRDRLAIALIACGLIGTNLAVLYLLWRIQ